MSASKHAYYVYCLLLLLVHIHSDCDLNNEDLHECMV